MFLFGICSGNHLKLENFFGGESGPKHFQIKEMAQRLRYVEQKK